MTIKDIIKKLIQQDALSPPRIHKASEQDLQYIIEILKKKSSFDKQKLICLKLLEAQILFYLGKHDYIKPLQQIDMTQNSKFVSEARLRICQYILQREDSKKFSLVNYHLQALDKETIIQPIIRTRIALIRAGKNVFDHDFLGAALCYLQASRSQQFFKDQSNKQKLIQKVVANLFLSTDSVQAHKMVCNLVLNPTLKQTKFYLIIQKLYHHQMIQKKQLQILSEILPQKIKQPDIEGVSVLDKAIFYHNMASIMNTFSSISFDTAAYMMGVNVEKIFVLIEKTYRNGEVLIDQISQHFYFEQQINTDELVRDFLEGIDQILGQ